MKPTLESVLRQKAKGTISIEHVVVDGASTDGTPEWLAEQLAAGNIERYVSEPDRGIYDAMNKGINLARGRVLAFLNAGDTYTDEDLVPCVLPICRGETESVAACAYRIDSSLGPFYKPNYSQLFFYCPCCHQTYFASARAYREIGGYDSRNIPGAAVSPPQPYEHCPDFSITKPAKPFNIACTHEPAHCQYCYPRVQRRQIPAARVGQPVGPNLRGLGGSLHRRRLHGRLCRRVG